MNNGMKTTIVAIALCLGAGFAATVIGVKVGRAQETKQGVVQALADVKFDPDDDVKCLRGVVETGNPDTGPSTFLLKAAANLALSLIA